MSGTSMTPDPQKVARDVARERREAEADLAQHQAENPDPTADRDGAHNEVARRASPEVQQR